MQAALKNIVDDLVKSIKDKMRRKGLDSSGKSSASLEGVATDTTAKVLGLRSIGALQEGRKPGKQPPPDVMFDYVVEKPVTIRNPTKNPVSDVESVAYLIGRKIGKEGTEIFKDNSKGLQLEEEIEEVTNSINELVFNSLNIQITSSIKNLGS